MQANDKVPIYPDLAGKVAVVTGGSGGIGMATCRLLAANGTKVAVNGRDQARLEEVVDRIRAGGGQAIGVAADCTDLAAVEQLRQQVESSSARPTSWRRSWGAGRRVPGRSPTSPSRTGIPPWTAPSPPPS
jgi:3-oxoacyl-[acyl-carrier protein] reductase